MNFLVIVAFILWIYLLNVFKRGKLDFFRYIMGSVGVFIFMMIGVQPFVTKPLIQLVTSVSGVFGKMTGVFEAYRDYSILFVENEVTGEAISLYVDYECSGVIEMLVFLSLLVFFQVYEVWQRVILGIIGCIVIFFSNVCRIFIICLMIKIGGNDIYYFAHTIVGRLFFYVLAVLLYYYVFTYAQIKKQKVGGFSYAQPNEHSGK
ncbi:MAG: exosortase family protein XrtG [Lachnospiraceae bacterium]|nr:exosortase family protein XrtG [Lachnospiraceae bacterium]